MQMTCVQNAQCQMVFCDHVVKYLRKTHSQTRCNEQINELLDKYKYDACARRICTQYSGASSFVMLVNSIDVDARPLIRPNNST